MSYIMNFILGTAVLRKVLVEQLNIAEFISDVIRTIKRPLAFEAHTETLTPN